MIKLTNDNYKKSKEYKEVEQILRKVICLEKFYTRELKNIEKFKLKALLILSDKSNLVEEIEK